MLKFESRDAPRDVCGGVELGQLSGAVGNKSSLSHSASSESSVGRGVVFAPGRVNHIIGE